MDGIKEKIDWLESETGQIRVDVASLVERSKYMANQAALDKLTERSKGFANQTTLDKLTERSKGFASQTALDALIERSDSFATKAVLHQEIGLVRSDVHKEVGLAKVDLMKEISATERRLNMKFDTLNNKITWTLLLPALTAIILWFVKVAILKI